jgi:hypothetical protein
MPRYFFHIRHSDQLVPDEEGAVFADDAAARGEALASARDIAADLVRSGAPVLGWTIEIVDEQSRVVGEVGPQDAIIQETPVRTARKSR